MAKTTRFTGPSSAAGPVPEQVTDAAATDLRLYGAVSDLNVGGTARIGKLEVLRQFVEKPPGWGERWRAALPQSTLRLVPILWIGDSTSVGPYSGQARTIIPRKVANAIVAAGYPDGGSGFINFDNTAVGFFGGPGGLNGPATDAVLTGAWTLGTNGVNCNWQRPTTDGNGGTITVFPRGTILDIISRTDPTFGRYDRQIDGGSTVQVPQNLAAAVQQTTISGLAAGYHSVKITSAAGQHRWHGVRGRNAVGVMIDNFSSGGRAITGSTNSLSTVSEGLGSRTSVDVTFDALTATPPDLAVLMMGANDADAANTGTPQTLRETLAALHRELRAVGGNNGQPDLIVVIQHISGFVDAAVPYRYSWIAETQRAWAQAHGAAIVDLWALGRFSGEYGAAQGWFGFGVTDVHPSDAGFTAFAAPIIDLILAG